MTVRKVPFDNPIDKKLQYLINAGLIENTTTELLLSEAFWIKFASYLSIDECEYILSFSQHSNWNYRLYNACLYIMNRHIDSILLE